MIEHTEISKVFTKIRTIQAKSLQEKILLLDNLLLQYGLVSELKQLDNLKDQILKLIQQVLPSEDVEDWIINLFRKDPISAIRLNHSIISLLKAEEYPFLKKVPFILFNHVYSTEPLKPGSSSILYQAFEKTKEEKYQDKILENPDALTGVEKVKRLALCYLLTRKEDYLTQAYELIIPQEEISKGDTLDLYIWELSEYRPDKYPQSAEFRNYLRKKVDLLLQSEKFELEDLHLALAYIRGEVHRWTEELFGNFTPVIDDYLKVLVDGETGAAILGRSESTHQKLGLKGTLKIGKISERPVHGIGHFGRDLLLDCTHPHVMFISGHRGSGKSYTMGVIAEELATSKMGIGAIIIDPIGVYWSMKYANWEEKEVNLLRKWNLEPKSFADNVKVFVPLGHFNLTPKETKDEAFSIRPCELGVDDWTYVFTIDRFSPRGIIIEKTLKLVQEGYEAEVEDEVLTVRGKGDNYSIEDIIRCINNSKEINDKDKGFTRQTRRAMVSRFEIAKEWGVFSEEGTPLIALSQPDQISVIDVSMLDEQLHALIAGIIARKVIRARLHISRQVEAAKIAVEETEAVENIPITWLLIDEAHLLVPQHGNTAATEPLVQYAKLGRKPGCGLILCTQQPSATNSQILSQLDLSCTHFLSYISDIDAFVHRSPGNVPSDIKDPSFFRSLPVGIGVFADESITTNRTFVVKIRPRVSQHAGRASLPKVIDQMSKPIIARGPEGAEKPSDEKTYITLPPASAAPESKSVRIPEKGVGPEMKPVKVPEKTPPFVPPKPSEKGTEKISPIPPPIEINLHPDQLKDYLKRLLLYKYRKHLYPAGSTKLIEKILFNSFTKDPSTILEATQAFILKKGWIIDKIVSDSDLPILLISKDDMRIAISLAKVVKSEESIMICILTAPKSADAQKMEDLFNQMVTQIK